MQTDWSKVQGFNWLPSWAPLLYEGWTHFEADQAARELQAAVKYGVNTIRVWFDWQAWRLRPEQALGAFEACIDVAGSLELRLIPTLFNRWVDGAYPAGGLALEHFAPPGRDWTMFYDYVDALVGCWRDDDRILCWDMCNEPLNHTIPITASLERSNPDDPLQAREIEFLASMCEHARTLRPVQPITMGTTVRENVRIFEPYVDVISFHPYANNSDEMARLCDEHLQIAHQAGKPLIATEVVRGSMDDEKHVEMAMWNIEVLESRGIGWVLWVLTAGKAISTRPDWRHGNCPPGDNAYMAFALPDGSLRPGHEPLADWLTARTSS